MQNHTSQELDIEGAHIHCAFGRFPDQSENFGQGIVQTASLLHFLPVCGDPGRKIIVFKILYLRLQTVDALHKWRNGFEKTFVFGAKNSFGYKSKHGLSLLPSRGGCIYSKSGLYSRIRASF
jgi:hypothetical protein